MNNDEAKKVAGRMTYGDAFRHACAGKRIPYKKATLTKIGELVEKQTPKKPTYTGEKNVYGAVVRVCSECGDKVCISPMAKEYENYCRRCGQRLTDWSYDVESECAEL